MNNNTTDLTSPKALRRLNAAIERSDKLYAAFCRQGLTVRRATSEEKAELIKEEAKL